MKPAAQSKFRRIIIKIGLRPGFWKAALRITPYLSPGQAVPLGFGGIFHPSN
jgi:hypothetical protein